MAYNVKQRLARLEQEGTQQAKAGREPHETFDARLEVVERLLLYLRFCDRCGQSFKTPSTECSLYVRCLPVSERLIRAIEGTAKWYCDNCKPVNEREDDAAYFARKNADAVLELQKSMTGSGKIKTKDK